ncbi:FtsW/RodA/SpoVE family cell cycle protein [Acetomicrobium hydrogeniformans]|uniref:Probable peptidoglycan glycosyltransferase FtsW n=1 Tax=Acetomicrobium hydrogeniformans ATCC BAA-1850 TaxID=592015 RepID=A0A0T5XD41_9BACT|nr:putative peptidoglycan glycosyltransferase FtsW [Acetomicrobium hydrogeniformans]KRT36283.1 putative cell division protein FtsW [Acetomicrobium hydrogeniformans ATCC BAA-1850]
MDNERGNFQAQENSHAFDLWLIVIPLALSVFGIIMITSASGYFSIKQFGTPWMYGMKQIKWFLVSLAGMALSYSVPTDIWRKVSPFLWILAFLLSFATLIPSFGMSVSGSSRWIRLGPFSFQPSEFLIFSVVIYLSSVISRYEEPPMSAFVRTMSVLIVSAIPLLFQPDIGSTMILFAIGLGIFIMKYGWKYPLILLVTTSVPAIILIFNASYRLRRLKAWIDPWQDPLNEGFQIIQGLIAFANGGFWGVGLGRSLQKLQYLPAAHTDFIFAISAEELGVLGSMAVIGAFAVISVRVYYMWRDFDDGYRRYLVFGLWLSILIPFFINVGGVTTLIPLTGKAMPFLSYGGSALLATWVKIGLLLRCSAENNRMIKRSAS